MRRRPGGPFGAGRARVGALALALGLAVAAAGSARAGYWLSAELAGPASARSAAVASMSPGTGPSIDAPPPLLGHFVGHVDDLAAALAFVGRWAFTGEPLPPPESRPLFTGPAPIPGGALADGFGVLLLSLVVDEAADDGGSRPFTWPREAPELPASWRPAAILSQSAPLFAAPAPRLPPLAESHERIARKDDLYLLGVVDRCELREGVQSCLRWAQVLAHGHGRWRGGYLPAAEVAPLEGWVRAKSGLPRALAVPAAIVGDEALVVLLARTRDYELHRATLRLPRDGDAFPAFELALEGEVAVIRQGEREAARLPLNAGLDARPR